MPWGAIIGGALGGLGSILGADKSADAAEDAAAVQWNMYRQNRNDLAPYREVGNSALNAYARAMGLPASTSGPGGTGGVSNHLTLLQGIRTKDKKGNRNVYADNYTGDIYRIDDLGEYQNIGNLYAGGGKNGSIDGIETNKNTRVHIDSQGRFHSRGKHLGTSFQLQDRPQEGEFIGDSPTNPEDPYGGFMESPGYQFRFDEGQRAVDRNAAARGRYMSGAREKASIRYGQNYASNEFGNYMNRLAAAANIGQTATNTGVGAGMNAAAYAGNAMQNAGNARASGYMGVANSIVNGINNWQASRAYSQAPNSAYGPYSGGYRYG